MIALAAHDDATFSINSSQYQDWDEVPCLCEALSASWRMVSSSGRLQIATHEWVSFTELIT
jgi:hypothetical protein